MLLIHNSQKLLLQKRATKGIWGALWCPPEIDTDVDSVQHCRFHWGLNVQPPVSLPALDHQFTHFKLRIYPQLLHVVSEPEAEQPQSIWISPADALKQGIPAPVRKLLERNFTANLKPKSLS